MSDERQTIMRNQMGVVDILPDTEEHIRVAVPNDRTFLSMVGGNQFMDGDEMRPDGWVYQQGKPYRKWFGNLYDEGNLYGRIWEPKLRNVAALEALRWKALQWSRNWYKKWWRPTYQAICALGEGKEIPWDDSIVVHARATHKRSSPDKYIWVKYLFHSHDGTYTKANEDFPYSYSMDWEEGEVENPQHVDLGQPFYNMDQHSRTVLKRKHVLLTAFKMAMEQWLREKTDEGSDELPQPEYDATLQIDINGRLYWFVSELTQYAGWRWRKLHWPEEDLMKTTIT